MVSVTRRTSCRSKNSRSRSRKLCARRCERYDLSKQVLEFCSADAAVCGEVVGAGRRGLLPEEIVVPVGLEVPKSEVRELMMDGQKELKVVSILGQEGFVSVGRPTSVKATRVEILRQVKPETDDHEEASLLEKQTSEIITKLWRFFFYR